MAELEIRPVTGALGAEVRGVDLRTVDDAGFEQVRALLHEHEVLFFPGADLSEDEHMAVGRRFGEVAVFPVARLYGATEPRFQVITDGPDSRPTADQWHTDVTWITEPPDYALLAATVVPERGGDTLWASMTAAYEGLSPTMQEIVAGPRGRARQHRLHRGRPGEDARPERRASCSSGSGPSTRRWCTRWCAPTPTPAGGRCSSAATSCAGSWGSTPTRAGRSSTC